MVKGVAQRKNSHWQSQDLRFNSHQLKNHRLATLTQSHKQKSSAESVELANQISHMTNFSFSDESIKALNQIPYCIFVYRIGSLFDDVSGISDSTRELVIGGSKNDHYFGSINRTWCDWVELKGCCVCDCSKIVANKQNEKILQLGQALPSIALFTLGDHLMKLLCVKIKSEINKFLKMNPMKHFLLDFF